MLAYYLERNLPDFQISVIFKSAEDWKKFVELHHKKNGWQVRLARDRTIKSIDSLQQMIWYESGELIGMTIYFPKSTNLVLFPKLTPFYLPSISAHYSGNANDFIAYTKKSYNQDIPATADPELLAQIAAENVANGIHQMVQ